jgi:hypothetical protein
LSSLGIIAIALGVAAFLAGAAMLFAYRLGKADGRNAIERANEEVKDAQLRAAALRPGTRDALVGRLRGDDF